LECPNGDLPDYKFFCFDGKMQYFYIRSDYAQNHEAGKMSFFDRHCNYLQGVGLDYCDVSSKELHICNNIKEMIEIAEKLSERFPHIRVDFYNINGNIYFGEMTFFNASGYFTFEPDSFDYDIGSSFVLPKKEISKG
jgi:hypothetical protein